MSDKNFSAFNFRSIEYAGRTFEFSKSLVLVPELDETKKLYCLEKPELGIDVYAYTREQLDLELKEQIAFLWDTYAMAADEELTVAAIAVKQSLLTNIRCSSVMSG